MYVPSSLLRMVSKYPDMNSPGNTKVARTPESRMYASILALPSKWAMLGSFPLLAFVVLISDEKIRCCTPAALQASVTALPCAISVSADIDSQKLVTIQTVCASLTAGAAVSAEDMSACTVVIGQLSCGRQHHPKARAP